ncbi:hypothetical protein GCM10010168_14790 [Actinoplanes ianthinogenes]|uniref:Uncharacterized protein n=1 Tax=Actinoplanes ianthinogenes TaxID=122358 RepID=A0ABM7LZF1_9ACTN|nr:hypothetical protein Aiant_53230 [Actinoplanes ianthinogenes]GGQ99283.1 hypothetical protein GCM10010168_14790 [Actinoplanes ianthinogenes]
MRELGFRLLRLAHGVPGAEQVPPTGPDHIRQPHPCQHRPENQPPDTTSHPAPPKINPGGGGNAGEGPSQALHNTSASRTQSPAPDQLNSRPVSYGSTEHPPSAGGWGYRMASCQQRPACPGRGIDPPALRELAGTSPGPP